MFITLHNTAITAVPSSDPQGVDKVHDTYGSLDNVGLVTIAPELPGALEVVHHLTTKGIKVSVGKFLCPLSLWHPTSISINSSMVL